jgi:H+/Cl- antiporter ClcA
MGNSAGKHRPELLPFPVRTPATHAEADPAAAAQKHENPQPNLAGLTVPARLWPAIVLTGVGAGLVGGLLMRLLHVVQHFCFSYQHGDFLTGVDGVSGLRRVAVLLCAGVVAGLVLLLVRRIPDRNGPGLTEAIWKHFGRLPERSMAVRSVLSVVIVGMGAAIGREGALKQAGALVGGKLSDWTPLALRLTPEQRRLLVACGAGAGMAAAYNVPLGGALFTLEVLLGTVSLGTVLPAFVTSFVATGVSWLLLPNEATYQVPYLPTTQSLLLWALVCGPLLGLGAALLARGIHWAQEHKPEGRAVVVLPIASFAVLGVAAIWLPQLLGNGKNEVQLAFDANLTGGLLFVLLILRPLATMLCLRAGAPGGLFTPTMTFGSLLGAAFGGAWSYLGAGADRRSCAIVGAGAVLAAATQAPISSVAFILELTYNANTLMVPLLLAVAGATMTFRFFKLKSIY